MTELWHYTSAGKQMEPVTGAELEQLARCGFLRPSDLVWRDGMPAWVKAGSLADLFPHGMTEQADESLCEHSSYRPVQEFHPTVADALPPPVVDDRHERRSRAERRPANPAKRTNRTALGVFIVGGLVAVAIIAVAVAYYTLRPGETIAQYEVDLEPGATDVQEFTFKAGTLYEFVVTSDRPEDFDLFVNNVRDEAVAEAIGLHPQLTLLWSPATSGVYGVEVCNQDDAFANSGAVTIRAVGTSRSALGKMHPKKRERVNRPFEPTNSVSTGPIPRDGDWETTVFFPVAKRVNVRVNSDKPENDVDLHVFDKQNRLVAVDDLPLHTCRLSFDAKAGMTYRFHIVNLGEHDRAGPSPAHCKLIYTRP